MNKKNRDQHKSRNMIRLADDVHAALKKLAQDNERAMTRELRLAIIEWLVKHKRWPTK